MGSCILGEFALPIFGRGERAKGERLGDWGQMMADEGLNRWVKTGMGRGIADALGIEGVGPTITAEESAKGLLEQVSGLAGLLGLEIVCRRCLTLTLTCSDRWAHIA